MLCKNHGMQWRRYGYGALEHMHHSSFGNSVHSAAAASLKMLKITKEKHFLPSRQKHA